MREIKFRAWDGHELFEVAQITIASCGWQCDEGRGVSIPHQSHIIMQYTGLKDKNGVEIFEGDVVAYCPDMYKSKQAVTYDEGWWHPLVRVEEGYNAIDYYNPDAFEVVGNIFENPGLLQEPDNA